MLDKKLLDEMIKQKYVSVRKHPSVELYIYNYTKSAQSDGTGIISPEVCPRWKELDKNGENVIRDFGKKLLENQKPMDPEASKILEDNWMDLI